jgi:hypothetical protein
MRYFLCSEKLRGLQPASRSLQCLEAFAGNKNWETFKILPAHWISDRATVHKFSAYRVLKVDNVEFYISITCHLMRLPWCVVYITYFSVPVNPLVPWLSAMQAGRCGLTHA